MVVLHNVIYGGIAMSELFDLMARDHGIYMLESELEDIREAVRKDAADIEEAFDASVKIIEV